MSNTNYPFIRKKVGNVQIVSVTKYRTREDIINVIGDGATCIGESRVGDAKVKLTSITGITKHFIGHLQSNKVRDAVLIFDVIETVDTVKLAKKISTEATAVGKVIEVFIQVNIGREEQKFGVLKEELSDFYNSINVLDGIRVTGLMCIVPNIDTEQRRKYFFEMKKLQVKLGLAKLSMGMSSDYEIAIQEGATEVRIGSALFK